VLTVAGDNRLAAADIEAVAHRLLGEPNAALSTKTELRYGRKRSLSIDLRKNVWKDFETGEGGGVLDLVVRELGGNRRDAARWLEGDSRVLGKPPYSESN
jgi:putative DNA primase/helicase